MGILRAPSTPLFKCLNHLKRWKKYHLNTSQHFYLLKDAAYCLHKVLKIYLLIPTIGTQLTCLSTSYPISSKKDFKIKMIRRYRSLSHLKSSILFIRTIRCLMPIDLANRACSIVCPPFSKPDSNSPIFAEITKAPTSA